MTGPKDDPPVLRRPRSTETKITPPAALEWCGKLFVHSTSWWPPEPKVLLFVVGVEARRQPAQSIRNPRREMLQRVRTAAKALDRNRSMGRAAEMIVAERWSYSSLMTRC